MNVESDVLRRVRREKRIECKMGLHIGQRDAPERAIGGDDRDGHRMLARHAHGHDVFVVLRDEVHFLAFRFWEIPRVQTRFTRHAETMLVVGHMCDAVGGHERRVVRLIADVL